MKMKQRPFFLVNFNWTFTDRYRLIENLIINEEYWWSIARVL